MPRLSIVIPCVGGAAEFDGTLVSVLQHRPADCDVLVVHSEAYDDPYDLRDEVEFLHCPGQSAAVELINAGIEAAEGEIVHVLGCGLVATENWTDAAIAHFDDPQVATVSPLVLSAAADELVSAGVRYGMGGSRRVVADQRLLLPGTARIRASILGPTLAAGFYCRHVLAALDGFDSRVGDAFADVDLALSIQSLERLNVCEPSSRLTTAVAACSGNLNPYERGRQAERLFWRHSPSAAAVALHPVCVAGDLLEHGAGLGTLSSLIGRAMSALEPGVARRQQERIAQARQRLEESARLPSTVRMPVRQQRMSQTQRRAA